MTDQPLRNCRILVVEDEYLLADELDTELADAGAQVLGPVPTVVEALALLDREQPDGAVLDVNLGGESVFPVADALLARGLPFIFTTGYDLELLPDRFAAVTLCEKPVDRGRIAATIGRLVHA